MDGTPIVDIKPYLPYADSVPDAKGGFASTVAGENLHVRIPSEIATEIAGKLPEDKREALVEILRQDPRPHYQDDPERIYGLAFAGMNIKFKVDGDILTVVSIE